MLVNSFVGISFVDISGVIVLIRSSVTEGWYWLLGHCAINRDDLPRNIGSTF